MTKLDQLLSGIAPEGTRDEVARRIDEAINRFLQGSAPIQHYEDFETHLFCFCRLVEGTVLRLRGRPLSANPGMDRGRFMPVISQAYGAQGLKAAFEMARTGNEGGFYAVLRRIAEVFVGTYAENEVSARVWTYWNGLSIPEKHAAADEYLSKYGQLLPSEVTEGAAVRVRANLPKVLMEHARMMQRLRRVGR